MRTRGLGSLLVLVTCAGIVLAGTAPSADAKPGYFVLSPSVNLAFSVRGSDGYKIEVTGSGKQVEIWVGRREGGLAKYHVPGLARKGVIKANLGRLGRIDLQFDARSVESDPGSYKCHGKPSLYELGTFRGTMRFRGEDDYTRFSANRIQGWISHGFHRVCKKPDWLLPDPHDGEQEAKDGDTEPKREITALGAAMSSHHRSASIRFTSIVLPKQPGIGRRLSLTGAKVEVHERRGRVTIERSDLTFADESALLFGPGENPTATLNLPPPFAGSGTFSTNPEGTATWSGSLRAHLPGADPVALTGPDFVAALCQHAKFEAVSRCLRPVKTEAERGAGADNPRHRDVAQGSGSHSQAFWDARLSWSR